jgi:hypothetical protein
MSKKLKGKARANARKKAQKATMNKKAAVQWTHTLNAPDIGINESVTGVIECLDVLRNDETGFKGVFKDKLGNLTTEFTLLANGKVKMVQDMDLSKAPGFMIKALRTAGAFNQNRVMDVDFCIYEFEYMSGAFNIKEQIKCSAMFTSLSQQYSKYTKEVA